MTQAALPLPLATLPLAPFLALNNAFPRELSRVGEAQFRHLVDRACSAKGFTTPPGFLLAFDETAGIDGVNYLWFKARYDRFVYIDRVVIDASAQRRGYASALYADLIAWAHGAGHTCIGCEINADPPNPASDAFHARFGFRSIGSAKLVDRGKTVRYMLLDLPSPLRQVR